MTRKEWNRAIKLYTQVETLRMSLDKDDPAREYLYLAECELDKVSRFIVPK
jgi:hypothetical protein